MIQYVLLAAQAAGTVISLFGQREQYKIGKRASQLEDAQMSLRLQQEEIASMEQSIFNINQLGETLATQRALMAARGGIAGVGSNLAAEQKSVSAFNADERARQLSLNFRSEAITAQKAMNKLTLAGKRSELGANAFEQIFNMVPFAEIGTALQTPKDTKIPGLNKLSSSPYQPKYRYKPYDFKPTKKAGLLTGG